MLFLLDGKTIPDNRHDVTIRLMDFIRDNPHQQVFEDDLFSMHYFQKGSGHITFKRLDLVEKMNDIVMKHYPGALPAKINAICVMSFTKNFWHTKRITASRVRCKWRRHGR
ncbi:prophage protein [Salmonella enterica subsp. enterica serovar Typhi]|nr:prophage protein [Salmonella enterica subsp. enterica serovar Typhi]HCB6758840.1 DUF4942 domain-containing protein [Salmonella enterica]CEQ76086.1 prophage protein [Salmonella enterica subsp. enterica serovar Typhi]CGH17139.1 prophage protein [Salmonella enterica subsp. enterica serovar Typhi]CGH94695.1 prophage protein [Salmonella enterica subsp. enterica serovar Typhi]